jgi:chromate transport protein ChrA
MLVMVAFFFRVKDSPTVKAMLTAVRPVVVGLLLWTAYAMAQSVYGADRLGWRAALAAGWDKVLLAAAAFVLLTFTSINPAWVILAAAALGFAVYR